MMIRYFTTLCIVMATLSVWGSVAAANGTLNVFAAASLRGALDDIADFYSSDVAVAYGGSSAIARQVSLGAPADVVILANPVWDIWLGEQMSEPDAHVPALLSNRLVIVGDPDQPVFKTEPTAAELLALLGDRRLAMGQRDAVPAGQYAREWMETQETWDTLAPKLAETDNVRAALALVERGEVPIAIVYASDAQASQRLTVLWDISASDHAPIRYPARALTENGAAFLSFLQSEIAQHIFEEHGFLFGAQ